MRTLVITVMSFTLLTGTLSSCKKHVEILPAGEVSSLAQVKSVSSGFFDFVDIQNAYIEFTLDVTDDAEVSSVTIMKSYNQGAFVEHETVTGFPATVKITAAEAVDGIPGVTLGDLAVGDVFGFKFKVNLADGRITEGGSRISTPVSCLSDLAGDYDVSTEGFIGIGGGAQGAPYGPISATVTVTRTADGVYLISDITGGMYVQIWSGAAQPGSIRDVCNQLTVITFNDQYGDEFTGTGHVNPDGSFEISWENEYGDTGTSVYTPK